MNNPDEINELVNPINVKHIPRDSTFNCLIEGRLDDPLQYNKQWFSHPLSGIILAHMCVQIHELHEDECEKYLLQ